MTFLIKNTVNYFRFSTPTCTEPCLIKIREKNGSQLGNSVVRSLSTSSTDSRAYSCNDKSTAGIVKAVYRLFLLTVLLKATPTTAYCASRNGIKLPVSPICTADRPTFNIYNDLALAMMSNEERAKLYKKDKLIGWSQDSLSVKIQELVGYEKVATSFRFSYIDDHKVLPEVTITPLTYFHFTPHIVRYSENYQLDLRSDVFAGYESLDRKMKDKNKILISRMEVVEGNLANPLHDFTLEQRIAFFIQIFSTFEVLKEQFSLQPPLIWENFMYKKVSSQDCFRGHALHEIDYQQYSCAEHTFYVPQMPFMAKLGVSNQWKKELNPAPNSKHVSSKLTLDELITLSTYRGPLFEPYELKMVKALLVTWRNKPSSDKAILNMQAKCLNVQQPNFF